MKTGPHVNTVASWKGHEWAVHGTCSLRPCGGFATLCCSKQFLFRFSAMPLEFLTSRSQPISIFTKFVAFLVQATENGLTENTGGLERRLNCKEDWLFFHWTWVQFPVPTPRFTIICNPSLRRSDAFFWLLWAPGKNRVHIYVTCKENTHTHKNNTSKIHTGENLTVDFVQTSWFYHKEMKMKKEINT